MKVSRMVLAGLFSTKRSAKKLQVNKETVRQLNTSQADQVFGGMGVYDTLLDCPYSKDSLCPVSYCAECG